MPNSQWGLINGNIGAWSRERFIEVGRLYRFYRNRKDYKRILWLFMKMAPKAGKEVPAPTQTEAKAKHLKTKKTALKGIHSCRKKIRKSPTFQQPKTLWLRRQFKYAQKSTPRRNKLDCYATIKFPHHQVSQEVNRRQDTGILCGCQGWQAPDQTGCEPVLWQ